MTSGNRRQLSTRTTLLASAALLLVPVILIVYLSLPQATAIKVVNASSHDIFDIQITHPHGEMQYVPGLGPGEAETRRLTPEQGAAIRVSFTDGHGGLKVAEGDTYVDPSEAGDIEIHISQDTVEFIDNLHPVLRTTPSRR
jgi:hypothetical protein